jgi:HTH-type transcriptional regulator/antitoxin HigA
MPEGDLFWEPQSPGQALRAVLEEKGWTQEEAATVTGTSRQTIAQILSDKSGITAEMAITFAAAFGNTPSYWLKVDAEYRLRQAKRGSGDIERRAKVFALAPIRDMQKRGWIKDTKNIDEIEEDLKQFFGVPVLDPPPQFSVATKRSASSPPNLTPAQRAWCFRARSLAQAIQVAQFNPELKVTWELTEKLRELAAYPKEARHLPKLFAEYGIRFVVVEPLPGARIDGAAFWLNELSPVIAMSVRYDRIDNFWFTVMHECSHVRHGDALSVDVDIEHDESHPDVCLALDLSEQRANVEAASYLIPASELDSFIGRVAPLYSKERIIQFAHSVKIHPGIIIGQLQHRGELHSSATREMLSKIRDIITETAVTDGWGRSISKGALTD